MDNEILTELEYSSEQLGKCAEALQITSKLALALNTANQAKRILDPDAGMLADMALESIKSQLDIRDERTRVPATEHFVNTASATYAGIFALEAANSIMGTIWEKVKAFLKLIFESIGKLFGAKTEDERYKEAQRKLEIAKDSGKVLSTTTVKDSGKFEDKFDEKNQSKHSFSKILQVKGKCDLSSAEIHIKNAIEFVQHVENISASLLVSASMAVEGLKTISEVGKTTSDKKVGRIHEKQNEATTKFYESISGYSQKNFDDSGGKADIPEGTVYVSPNIGNNGRFVIHKVGGNTDQGYKNEEGMSFGCRLIQEKFEGELTTMKLHTENEVETLIKAGKNLNDAIHRGVPRVAASLEKLRVVERGLNTELERIINASESSVNESMKGLISETKAAITGISAYIGAFAKLTTYSTKVHKGVFNATMDYITYSSGGKVSGHADETPDEASQKKIEGEGK